MGCWVGLGEGKGVGGGRWGCSAVIRIEVSPLFQIFGGGKMRGLYPSFLLFEAKRWDCQKQFIKPIKIHSPPPSTLHKKKSSPPHDKYKRQPPLYLNSQQTKKSQSDMQHINVNNLWQQEGSTHNEEQMENQEEAVKLMAHNLMQLQHQLAASKCARGRDGRGNGGEDIVIEEGSGEQEDSYGRGRQFKGDVDVDNSKITATTRQSQITQLRSLYHSYLSTHTLPTNHQQKILHLLEQPMTPPTAVALFQMLYYFKQALHPDLLDEISHKALDKLREAEGKGRIMGQELICYGELIGECECESEELCRWVTEGMLGGWVEFQEGFYVLSNQGVTGLVYLVDMGQRGIYEVSEKILEYLCRTQVIVIDLIIPELMKDIQEAGINRGRELALAALNRLAPLITTNTNPSKDILTQLTSLLHDPSLDKKLLLATIRSATPKGQQILLDIIKSKQLTEHSLALALSTLSWRVPNLPVLRIKTIEYTLEHCFLPGRLYQYEGAVQPWDFGERHCGDTLCISSRDFLGMLDIYLREKAMGMGIGGKVRTGRNNRRLSSLVQVLNLEVDGQGENQKSSISEDVVRVLLGQLRNKSAKIREIALLQLGNIGHPQTPLSIALQPISKCLSDGDSSIRSAACWTLSRIFAPSDIFPKKLQQKLVELLKDSYWKVRTSACIALGLVVGLPQRGTIEILVRVLQDGSVPKQVVCETLAKIGAEELLLEIVKGSPKNDFKLRQSAIASFSSVRLTSTLLPLLLEELLKCSRDPRVETRQLCLLTLATLRERVYEEENKNGGSHSSSIYSQGEQENANSGNLCLASSYFQTKKLLPFYYFFLDDPSGKIRGLASQNLLSLGAQAELLFIEGMTKGQPLTKIQCIRCLAQLGVQNFRAIVLGLRDPDPRVRKAASDSIVDTFRPEEIIEEFGGQGSSLGLVCNLREILRGNPKAELAHLIEQVLRGLERGQGEGMDVKTYPIAQKYHNRRYPSENIRANMQ